MRWPRSFGGLWLLRCKGQQLVFETAAEFFLKGWKSFNHAIALGNIENQFDSRTIIAQPGAGFFQRRAGAKINCHRTPMLRSMRGHTPKERKMTYSSSRLTPVFDLQSGNPIEMRRIAGNQYTACFERRSGNDEVRIIARMAA